eukprot:1037248-Pelagomonas_calceolata.AAC.5
MDASTTPRPPPPSLVTLLSCCCCCCCACGADLGGTKKRAKGPAMDTAGRPTPPASTRFMMFLLPMSGTSSALAAPAARTGCTVRLDTLLGADLNEVALRPCLARREAIVCLNRYVVTKSEFDKVQGRAGH